MSETGRDLEQYGPEDPNFSGKNTPYLGANTDAVFITKNNAKGDSRNSMNDLEDVKRFKGSSI